MTIAEIKKALECCHTMAVKCYECPLYERKGDWTNGQDCDDVLHEEILKVWDNIVLIGTVEQIKWERDMAMQQLKEHGIPFCGIADDVVKVVRCKDCKYEWRNGGDCVSDPDWFCADGTSISTASDYYDDNGQLLRNQPTCKSVYGERWRSE